MKTLHVYCRNNKNIEFEAYIRVSYDNANSTKMAPLLSGTVYNFILFPDSILDVASVIKILKSYEKYAFYSHAMFAFPLDV